MDYIPSTVGHLQPMIYMAEYRPDMPDEHWQTLSLRSAREQAIDDCNRFINAAEADEECPGHFECRVVKIQNEGFTINAPVIWLSAKRAKVQQFPSFKQVRDRIIGGISDAIIRSKLK